MRQRDTTRPHSMCLGAAPCTDLMPSLTTACLATAVAAAAILAATPSPAAAGAAEIAAAFESQGMAPETSRCYGQQISDNLDPSRQEEAARIVSSAENGEEIEEDVKAGGLDMVEAFLAAKTACGT